MAFDKKIIIDRPISLDPPQADDSLGTELVEASALINAGAARQDFHVTGKGLTAAVLDTGINVDHVDFQGRIVAQQNFTSDNGGDKENATDGDNHGSNVSGIIAADGDHLGIAPCANLAALKVLKNNGEGSFDAVAKALQWVVDNQAKHKLSVVCMSLGGRQNFVSDQLFANDKTRKLIQKLRSSKVAVCVSAGNDYFRHSSAQGMSFPAIIRECVSVGAVFDATLPSSLLPLSYQSGAIAYTTSPDEITPFSQRLHQDTNSFSRTDIFAPGAPVRSAGAGGPHAQSIQHGTSQAAPVVAGVLLLLQEFHQRRTGTLPEVDTLVDLCRASGKRIEDGDDEDNNVVASKKTYIRIDALNALKAMQRALDIQALQAATPTS